MTSYERYLARRNASQPAAVRPILSTSLGTAAIDDVWPHVEPGTSNHVPLSTIRACLHGSRDQQDALILEACRAGRYWVEAAEGRGGLTQAERDGALTVGSDTYHYISRR